MLFNEPKLLKLWWKIEEIPEQECFSALQRAEIAEILYGVVTPRPRRDRFSALQRAEIAEISPLTPDAARR